MATIKKYRFVNNNRSIKRVIDFLQFQRSPVFGKFKTSKEFLDEQDENNVSNFQRILKAFIDNDTITAINDSYTKGDYDNIVIPYGIEFVATQTKINISNYAFQGVRLITQPDAFFKASKLVELELNREYIKVDEIHSPKNTASGKLIRQLSQVSVWVWSRALGKTTKLFDASPFSFSIKTSVTENGGAFSMQLPPITYRKQKNDQGDFDWIFDKSALRYFNNRTEFLAKTPVFKVGEKNELLRNDFLFHDLIQQNDLIFIKFESLKLEKRSNTIDTLLVDSSQLPNSVFDMIGLVDDCRINVTSQNTCEIDITGRDLIKLFIDDGTYFFPFEVAGANEYFASGGKNNELTKRLFTGGGSLTSFDMNGGEMSIVEVFQFVMQQLSNITICPADLLQSYPDSGIEKNSFIVDQKKNANIQQKNTSANYITQALNKGIFKLINIVTDEYVDQRVVVDSSLSTATGSLLNFLQSVCQKEFFELSFDTYGDQWYTIIRKPPFDLKAYQSLLNNTVKTKRVVNNGKKQVSIDYEQTLIIEIDDSIVYNEALMWETEVYSWYHFSPRGNILGASYNLNFIPAVFLPEYAEIWGAKPYMLQHNYLNFPTKQTATSGETISNLESQGMLDLKFLIETTCYLPFTRKGTITVLGDRRLKRGNFIRYKPTGEIFYIDSVTQTYSNTEQDISRLTTLNVSRGMVEKYILDPVNSYFKILNLKKDIKFKTVTEQLYQTKTTVVNQKEVDVYKAQIDASQVSAVTDLKQSFNNYDPLNIFKNKNADGTLKILATPSFLIYSKDGVDFTKQWEKFTDHAYWDGRDPNTGQDHYSIGYGHQIQPAEGGLMNRLITEAEASAFLYNDVNNTFVPQVRRLILQYNLTLNQNQFDAAVDFTYTTGTLWNNMCQKIKLYTDGKISDEALIAHWTTTSITQMGSSLTLQNLFERRKAEVAKFLDKPVSYVNNIIGSNPQPIITTEQVKAGTKTNKVIDRDDFFKNFVVNKDVFKFFLERMQKNVI